MKNTREGALAVVGVVGLDGKGGKVLVEIECQVVLELCDDGLHLMARQKVGGRLNKSAWCCNSGVVTVVL